MGIFLRGAVLVIMVIRVVRFGTPFRTYIFQSKLLALSLFFERMDGDRLVPRAPEMNMQCPFLTSSVLFSSLAKWAYQASASSVTRKLIHNPLSFFPSRPGPTTPTSFSSALAFFPSTSYVLKSSSRLRLKKPVLSFSSI